MNHDLAWWRALGEWTLGFLLGVALVLFVVRSWIEEASRDWHAERDRLMRAQSYPGAPVPGPSFRYGTKPWYVRKADQWAARRAARFGKHYR